MSTQKVHESSRISTRTQPIQFDIARQSIDNSLRKLRNSMCRIAGAAEGGEGFDIGEMFDVTDLILSDCGPVELTLRNLLLSIYVMIAKHNDENNSR